MESGPLSSTAFHAFARRVIPYCHVTTKVEGDPDQDLLRERRDRGFPILVFMNAKGEVLSEQSDRTVAGLEKSRHALSTLAKLDTPDRAKDKSVAAAIFIARLELGRFGLRDAKARRRSLDLDEPQTRVYSQEIVNLTVSAHYAEALRDRDYTSLGPKFEAMMKAGQIPTGTYSRNFWSRIMQHAQHERGAKLYEASYREYKKLLGDGESYRRIFARYDAVLEALKNGQAIPRPPNRAKTDR